MSPEELAAKRAARYDGGPMSARTRLSLFLSELSYAVEAMLPAQRLRLVQGLGDDEAIGELRAHFSEEEAAEIVRRLEETGHVAVKANRPTVMPEEERLEYERLDALRVATEREAKERGE
jgi:hypothetical protein